MTDEEFEGKLEELKSTFDKGVKELSKAYALSRNNIKVGDVIDTDHGVRIVVDDIKFVTTTLTGPPTKPVCVYYGVRVTKAFQKYKSEEYDRVHQSRVTKNHGPLEDISA